MPDNMSSLCFQCTYRDEILSYEDYGHLQLNAVSLYLLYLVEMISSGLQIIYNTDEVSYSEPCILCGKSLLCA